MKRYGLLLLAILCLPPVAASAQETLPYVTSTEEPVIAPVEADSIGVAVEAPAIEVNMPAPFGMYGITPFSYSYATWELHPGFNASIGLSITFSPNKYAPSGVGFGQDFAFMYAMPVNDRFSVAAGLYATHLDWGVLNYRNVGFAAVAAYRLTDRISLYAYGNKSFIPHHTTGWYPLPGYTPDRFGGMVNFKIGESSSISIGVEGWKNGSPRR